MRPNAIAIALLGGVLSAVVAAAPGFADDRTSETKLQTQAKQLDADGSRASNTSDGQRRLTERIASQFKVQPSVVIELRNRKLGFGGATIALALSQELMKRNPSLTQQAALDTILAQRQAGKGWGVIAHEQGLKLGHVISEVKKADKAAEHIASKPEKIARAERPEKLEKAEKPEKIERPAKPDKAGR